MIKIPTEEELLLAACHFGHRSGKTHPKMKPFLQKKKSGTVNLIDLTKTVDALKKVVDFISKSFKKEDVILFVGTKPPAKEIIKKYAEEVNMPYVNEHWIGGTLTNFSTISKSIEKYKKMIKEKEQGEWEKYTKKEQIDLERELERLEKNVGGIKNMTALPNFLYIVDLVEEKTAVREANRLKIPIIAIVDSNANPDLVDYPIPANDDAIKSIDTITKTITEAIKEKQK
ncbi:30S ribosomal protein S2 [bacterium]|nr:30S ribosomal protein S2 [bacterium]